MYYLANLKLMFAYQFFCLFFFSFISGFFANFYFFCNIKLFCNSLFFQFDYICVHFYSSFLKFEHIPTDISSSAVFQLLYTFIFCICAVSYLFKPNGYNFKENHVEKYLWTSRCFSIHFHPTSHIIALYRLSMLVHTDPYCWYRAMTWLSEKQPRGSRAVVGEDKVNEVQNGHSDGVCCLCLGSVSCVHMLPTRT